MLQEKLACQRLVLEWAMMTLGLRGNRRTHWRLLQQVCHQMPVQSMLHQMVQLLVWCALRRQLDLCRQPMVPCGCGLGHFQKLPGRMKPVQPATAW